MYQLLRKGVFGNIFQTWTSINDFLKDDYSGPMGVRCSDAPNAPFITDLTVDEALAAARQFENKGYSVILYEASPKKWITIQGEIKHDAGYHTWRLEWTTVRKHMRQAFKEERLSAMDREAWAIIRRHFWEPSYEELLYIFENWPGHTVEFTAYAVPVGILKGRNVQFWEVRTY